MSTMLVLFYLFCDGKTEDNLGQMFNMFDMDGNKVLPIQDMIFMKVMKSDDHSKTDDLTDVFDDKTNENYICTT